MKCGIQITDGASKQFVLCVHNCCVVVFNMSKFILNKEHLWAELIFCFHLKKTAAESYRLLREVYGEYVLSQNTRERCSRRFRSGDFDVTDEEHAKPPKNSKVWNYKHCRTKIIRKIQKQLAGQSGVSQQTVSNRLREIEKIQKTDRWVSHELNDRQMDILVARYKTKSFLHRIVRHRTAHEKWTFFENSERKESWVAPGASSTSTARPNHFDRKTMLCV